MTKFNKTLWLSGLLTGAVVGAYLYKNKEQYGPQKEKMNKLLGELQSVVIDLKGKLLHVGQEGLDATKSAINSAKEKVDKAK